MLSLPPADFVDAQENILRTRGPGSEQVAYCKPTREYRLLDPPTVFVHPSRR